MNTEYFSRLCVIFYIQIDFVDFQEESRACSISTVLHKMLQAGLSATPNSQVQVLNLSCSECG